MPSLFFYQFTKRDGFYSDVVVNFIQRGTKTQTLVSCYQYVECKNEKTSTAGVHQMRFTDPLQHREDEEEEEVEE